MNGATVNKRSWLVSASATGSLAVMLVGWFAVTEASRSPDAPSESPPAAQSAATKWITADGDRPSTARTPDPDGSQVRQRPKSVNDGPLSRRLSELTGPLFPNGRRTHAIDYPDLAGASVSYALESGGIATVAVQRLKNPMPLGRITMGATQDTLREWPSGSQYVEVGRTLPYAYQLVIAHHTGVLYTVTVNPAESSGKIEFADERWRSALLTRARDRLDQTSANTGWI